MPDTPTILTPGPVYVPPFILEAISQPVIHQRSPAFEAFFKDLNEGLGYFFQTENPVLSLPGTGTFAVEATMRSLFRPGEQVAIQANGKFSERWLDYGAAIGLQVVPMRLPWGQSLEPNLARALLQSYPGLRGMVLTHCETSTGVQIDLEEVAHATKELRPDLLLVCDAMSTVGAIPYYHDDWKIDASISSAQKGLFNLAGTAFVALSPLALASLDMPRAADAMHLGHYWRYLAQGSFPFTPPTQLLYGVKRALDHLQEVGLPGRWNLAHQLSRRFKQGLADMGGEIFGEGGCDSLTAFSLGNGDQDALRAEILARGFELAGGQGPLKGKVMRAGHFGWLGRDSVEDLLAVISTMKSEGRWTPN